MSGFWHESDISLSDDSDGGCTPEKMPVPAGKKSAYYKKNTSVTSVEQKREDNTRSDWLSGPWPLKPFNESLPPNQRKAEWFRFKGQFERIVSCKGTVDSSTKLTGLKIFAGDYLLSIIELQEKMFTGDQNEVYDYTINALNKYFGQTCDTAKERIKFREMEMEPTESFMDWVLRLESQAKFCDFVEDQRKEEFVQALIRRSVPDIAQKLFEMSNIWENDLELIMNHGKHLDYIRNETRRSGEAGGRRGLSIETPESTYEDSRYKPVNTVSFRKRKLNTNRFGSFRKHDSDRFPPQHGNNFVQGPSRRRPWISDCTRCGENHVPMECKAYRAQCYRCGKWNHFKKVCYSPIDDNEHRKHSDWSRSGRKHVDRQQQWKKEAENINQLLRRMTPQTRRCIQGNPLL
ncbi:uncharacterized protein LOC129739530 isoform X1 [Uranotaenia lowii]|uniref:uncharacterized protein LOC129739530 isoform X1 n=1 Tax=Uranotaenia lowii TaxID=190385 RepID=UPI002478FCFE|nr:uncharacterized protein LOC129739530 isoform X1 [Uranotaenia lowii]